MTVDDFDDCYTNCIDNQIMDSAQECRTHCEAEPNPTIVPPSNDSPNGTGEGGTTTDGDPKDPRYTGPGRQCYGSFSLGCDPYQKPD